jgi:hypothetical protein
VNCWVVEQVSYVYDDHRIGWDAHSCPSRSDVKSILHDSTCLCTHRQLLSQAGEVYQSDPMAATLITLCTPPLCRGANLGQPK